MKPLWFKPQVQTRSRVLDPCVKLGLPPARGDLVRLRYETNRSPVVGQSLSGWRK